MRLKSELDNRMKKTVILSLLVLINWIFAGTIVRADSQSAFPRTITLLTETKLYNSPNEKDESKASISPQNVTVITAEENWLNHYGNQKVWLKLGKTWLGEKWIYIPYTQIGVVIPKDDTAFVTGPIALANTPFRTDYTGVTLPSQNVHVTAWFERPRGAGLRAYLLETDTGEKWFSPYDEYVIEPIEKIDQSLTFKTSGHIYQLPFPNSSSEYFEPQVFHAFEKYKDFYHVETTDGEKFWVNRTFSEPEQTESVNLTLQLTDGTFLFEYPNEQTKMKGTLAPQNVTAIAKYIDSWGNSWFKIKTYAGESWIHNGEIDPKGIKDDEGYVHVLVENVTQNNNIVMITGRVKLVKEIGIRFDESLGLHLQILDQQGNSWATVNVPMDDIAYGEELSFYGVVDTKISLPINYSIKVLPVTYISE